MGGGEQPELVIQLGVARFQLHQGLQVVDRSFAVIQRQVGIQQAAVGLAVRRLGDRRLPGANGMLQVAALLVSLTQPVQVGGEHPFRRGVFIVKDRRLRVAPLQGVLPGLLPQLRSLRE